MNRRTKETQSNAGINSALQGGGRPKVKSFGQKSWMLPQPVLIIGTYDKNGKPNAMNAAWAGQWDMKGDYDLDGKSRYHRQPKKWR
jgi:flavin reductase (DIM6/NTAB) family NADH-FMN oxidoreductase RutF